MAVSPLFAACARVRTTISRGGAIAGGGARVAKTADERHPAFHLARSSRPKLVFLLSCLAPRVLFHRLNVLSSQRLGLSRAVRQASQSSAMVEAAVCPYWNLGPTFGPVLWVRAGLAGPGPCR
eukprot:7503433-Pyramimonas_sp.AAC.1